MKKNVKFYKYEMDGLYTQSLLKDEKIYISFK